MRRERMIMAATVAATIVAIGLSLFIGPAPIGFADALAALAGQGEAAAVAVIRDIRLPRALAAFAVGAALGASGATLQGLLRNPLADPGVLGVSSAAALGAVIAIYFGASAVSPLAAPIGAVSCALASVLLLSALGAGRVSPTRLILVGVGLSTLAGALIALVMNLAPNPFVLSDLVNWLFGAVANRSFDDLAFAVPLMLAGFGLAVLSARGLTALSLGEATAASIGVDVARIRFFAVTGAALMTGASVALAGAVGFVGVVAPHLARPLVGEDPGRAILPAALIGGAILALADLAIRLLPFDQELKLGVAAALIGAPAFIAIAARTQRLGP